MRARGSVTVAHGDGLRRGQELAALGLDGVLRGARAGDSEAPSAAASGSGPVVAEPGWKIGSRRALALDPEPGDGYHGESGARADGRDEVVRVRRDLEEAGDVAAG